MACNQDYVKAGTKLTCKDPCKLKKFDKRYPNGKALTVKKEYTCKGQTDGGKNFEVVDDGGCTRKFPVQGDKYFETSREDNGSFGGCAGFVSAQCASGCESNADEDGSKPQELFYCKTSENSGLIVNCKEGSCRQAIAPEAGCSSGATCDTVCTTSSRCTSLAETECNKTSPLCPQ